MINQAWEGLCSDYAMQLQTWDLIFKIGFGATNMNIFYLHHVPDEAAKMHCDKHVSKMIVESAQLLSTAHHVAGSATSEMYKKTHVNHPSAIWVRKCWYNYDWTYTLLQGLCSEYTKRYGKVHKTYRLLDCLLKLPKGINYNNVGIIPPQCMPDEFQNSNVTQAHCVSAYRAYYHSKKFAKWAHSPTPEWWNN